MKTESPLGVLIAVGVLLTSFVYFQLNCDFLLLRQIPRIRSRHLRIWYGNRCTSSSVVILDPFPGIFSGGIRSWHAVLRGRDAQLLIDRCRSPTYLFGVARVQALNSPQNEFPLHVSCFRAHDARGVLLYALSARMEKL